MDITQDIQPLTTFRNNPAEVPQHLKPTNRPVVLKVNGKAASVVQDAEADQHLLDLAAEASAAGGIRQGLEDLAIGRTRPAIAAMTPCASRMPYHVDITERAERDLW